MSSAPVFCHYKPRKRLGDGVMENRPSPTHYRSIISRRRSSADPVSQMHRVPAASVYTYVVSRTSLMTRDIDIGILSVRLSVTFRYCIETA